jgi:hypothetical protein
VRINWAIPCRYAEVQQQGATIVGAGADLVVVPELPAPVGVLFAIRFVGDPEELDGVTPHKTVVRLFDPDGASMGEQEGQIIGGPVQQVVVGYLAEVIIPMGVVIDAQRDGSYSVEFEIDGDRLRVPIHVVVGPTD